MKKLQWILMVLIVSVIMQGAMAQDSSSSNEETIMLTSTDMNSMSQGHGRLILLTDLLSTMEEHFDVTFLYKDEVMMNKYVPQDDIQIGAKTGRELARILAQLGITFQRIDVQTYVLLAKDLPIRDVSLQEEIRGTVTDGQTGEPLPGVNVIVKGTTMGTSTDRNGDFELTVESLQDTLVVSFVGYLGQEVAINGRTEIAVTLQPQTIAGEELVVIGYGTQRVRDLTGSVSSISPEELAQQQSSSLDQLLRGQVAGVHVTTNSSKPGGGISVRIRGTGSITSGSEPLFVIDGMPVYNSTENIPGTGSNQIGRAHV